MSLSCGEQIGLLPALRNDEASTCFLKQSLSIIIVINEECVSGGLFILFAPQINSKLLGLSQFVDCSNEMVLQLNFLNLLFTLRIGQFNSILI